MLSQDALVLAIFVTMGAVAFYVSRRKPQTDEQGHAISVDSGMPCYPVFVERGRENLLSVWNESWGNLSRRGRVTFWARMEHGGLIVALSNKLGTKRDGGLALVIDDVHRNSTFFTELPYVTKPRASSGMLNGVRMPRDKYQEYFVEWDEQRAAFGTTANGVLLTTKEEDFPRQGAPGRYLAFGARNGVGCTENVAGEICNVRIESL